MTKVDPHWKLQLNGVTLLPEAPEPFIEQAHAIIATASNIVDARSGETSPFFNSEVLGSLLRGVETLLHLALISSEAREHAWRETKQ